MLTRKEIKRALRGPSILQNTPFLRNGDIDFKGLKNSLDFNINAGAKVIMLTIGDSLFTLLTDKEILEITKVTCQHVAQRAIIVASDKQWWTGKDVEFAKAAREVGADMLMVSPPDWGGSCTPETFRAHYAAIAEHIPVMLVTNVFQSRSLDFTKKTMQLIRDSVENVIAVKDDIGATLGKALARISDGKWALTISGSVAYNKYLFPKESFLEVYPFGYDGYISFYLSFKPEIAWSFWNSITSNDLRRAADITVRYEMTVTDFMESFMGGSGSSGATQIGADALAHGTLELYGIAERWRRPPYYNLNDEEMDRLKCFYQELKLL